MKNIKNIFTIAAGMFLVTAATAQTPDTSTKETREVKVIKKTTEINSRESKENEIKNFRFGLAIMPSVNWYDTESKIIQRNGVAIKFGGGLITEFRLAKVASIQTGINILNAGGQVTYKNGGLYNPGATTVNYYYNNKADDIVEYNSVTPSTVGSHTRYQLNTRKYKTTYIGVPILLKLKTREIGAMVYFGQFGLNSFFRWKARANDEVQIIDGPNSGTNEKKTNLMISKDASIYNAALNFGFGTEWNLAGTTSMVFGVNYNLGFTNVLKKHSEYLEKRFNHDDYNVNSTTNNTYYTTDQLEQIVKENSIVLTIGVLF
jgi:hypothetical protein